MQGGEMGRLIGRMIGGLLLLAMLTCVGVAGWGMGALVGALLAPVTGYGVVMHALGLIGALVAVVGTIRWHRRQRNRSIV